MLLHVNGVRFTYLRSLNQMTDLSHHHADLKHVFQLQSLKILGDEASVEEETKDVSRIETSSTDKQDISKTNQSYEYQFR